MNANAQVLRGRAVAAGFEGMLQILRFNWSWYALALACSLANFWLLSMLSLSPWLKLLLLSAIGCTLFWSVSSLLVSHWIYDCSRLREWKWILNLVKPNVRRAINIHAGFDETTPHLRALLPGARIAAWDIFDGTTMTEPSIARARLQYGATNAIAVDFRRLPESDGCLDLVFLIFAAHEIRSAIAREEFFGEISRILQPAGQVVIAEHLRDAMNFMAYGPGFLHFLPRGEWIRVSNNASLRVAREFCITPFIRVFLLRKPSV